MDLFDFRLINFPVFNVADICVCCGTGLLLIYILFIERKEHHRFEIRQEVKNMSSPLCLPVEEQQNGERIDKFLQESIPGMSRSQAEQWIAQGFVKIGEKQAGKNDKLKSGMSVFVILPESAEDADGEIDWEAVLHPVWEPKPSNIPLDIVYEDEHLLVVNKPKIWWSIREQETKRIHWLMLFSSLGWKSLRPATE